ncbi:restriction endonuclease [Luteibacter sp. CQ10]|uniref:restriction endonuclease n=1 Tax=Luteibacter sp. CQ10 TaxID=2805821 RepID=UPI0034A519E8
MSGFKPVRHRYEDALTRVSWQAFERLIADHFRQLGYRVEHRGTGEGGNQTDGGIDLLLHRDLETILVQCKHWTAFQVPHNAVHELIGVMHTAAATGAIVITSGEFTKAAIDAAAKFRHIRLIDGRGVRAMLGPVAEPAPELPLLPTWAMSSLPGPSKTGLSPRSHIAAAIAAVGVMGVALAMLYVFYIHEIEHARTMALHARATEAVTPSAVHAARPVTEVVSTVDGQPAVVHGAPTSKRALAEWTRQNAEAMKILERTTPELP